MSFIPTTLDCILRVKYLVILHMLYAGLIIGGNIMFLQSCTDRVVEGSQNVKNYLH